MSNEKLRTYQQIMIMEGGDNVVEAAIITQLNDESIRMKSYQFMEEINEHDSKQVINQKPSFV